MQEKFAANNCSDIVLLQKDNLNDLEKFDIILANINLNVITNSINKIKQVSHPSSQLLLSGFLISDEQALIFNFASESFKHITPVKKDEWITMLLTKS